MYIIKIDFKYNKKQFIMSQKKIPQNDIMPLVPEEKAEELYFYYKIDGYDKIYRIPHRAASIIPFFKSMITNNKYECLSRETCLTISPTIVNDDCTDNKTFKINTPEMHDFLEKYIDIWKDKSHKEPYIKAQYVQTGNPDQLIKPADLALLREYLENKKNNLSIEKKRELANSSVKEKYFYISALNPLLNNMYGFLGMKGLSNKINTFIATIIWNCSLFEIAEVSDSLEFKEQFNALQQQVINK